MTATKRLWRLLAVLLAFTLVAAACGDDDDDSSASTSESESASSSESESASASEMAEEDDDEMAEEDDDEMAEDESAGAMISEDCPIPNPAETVELDVMGWEFPIITAYADELAECEEGNYSLNYQFLDSTEARNAMTQDAATGAPTFELYQGSNAFIGELANQGFLMPLNDLVDKYRDE
ncbi:MAG: extracellular solute-binding protein, partial [Actinomycetota bacterium]